MTKPARAGTEGIILISSCFKISYPLCPPKANTTTSKKYLLLSETNSYPEFTAHTEDIFSLIILQFRDFKNFSFTSFDEFDSGKILPFGWL